MIRSPTDRETIEGSSGEILSGIMGPALSSTFNVHNIASSEAQGRQHSA